jgi:(p)ppGpp synthase/HD superfamily hydrolase
MKPEILVPQLMEAVKFATNAHLDQVRGGEIRTPYVNHCFDVSSRVSQAGFNDPSTLIAALLHDTVEDTRVTIEQINTKFGVHVAGLVHDLTLPDDVKKDREAKHIFQLGKMRSMGIEGQAIKIADKTSNVLDLFLAPPKWGLKAIRGYSDAALEVVLAAEGPQMDTRISELVILFKDAYRVVSNHYGWESRWPLFHTGDSLTGGSK